MSCWACSENERKAIWCEPVDDARTLWMVFAPPVPGEFKPRALVVDQGGAARWSTVTMTNFPSLEAAQAAAAVAPSWLGLEVAP